MKVYEEFQKLVKRIEIQNDVSLKKAGWKSFQPFSKTEKLAEKYFHTMYDLPPSGYGKSYTQQEALVLLKGKEEKKDARTK